MGLPYSFNNIYSTMENINKTYVLLEKMVNATLQGNGSLVTELNQTFSRIAARIHHSPQTSLELQYDRCRTSCVMAFRNTSNKDSSLKDAQTSFSEIPNPKQEK